MTARDLILLLVDNNLDVEVKVNGKDIIGIAEINGEKEIKTKE